jgi:hypothetical protein
MKCAAATFPDVTAYNARAYAPRGYRRAAVGGAVLGLGSVSAVAVMAGAVTVAAAWMVANSLSGNPNLRAGAPFALETASLPPPPMRLADPADLFGSALAAADPAYAPAPTREDKLAEAAAPLSPLASRPAPPPRRIAELTKSVPIPPKHEIARAPAVPVAPARGDETHDARLAAVAPHEVRTAELTPRAAPAASVMPAPSASPDVTGSINVASHVSPPRPAPRLAAPAAQLAYNNPDVPTGMDSHTAIYDIVAHTVYLPDGERLEAHSGLGQMLDDPHYVSERGRGATPPNVYDLTLRDGLFHGVQAIRLNPVADSKMYGRAGILAHTYMLGPSGQSFGCVSFKDYDEFLRAFRRGEVDRLVVVPHLQSEPWATRARRADGSRYAFDIGSAH